jgi:hypothetical protein
MELDKQKYFHVRGNLIPLTLLLHVLNHVNDPNLSPATFAIISTNIDTIV